MQYRREIDGLRAIAVLPVILFHAGFDVFSGGYVGVDVFFVISGYLITSLLLKDLKEERFSLLKFYERRARRILPALLFVMLCCLPFAWMWLVPQQLEEFGQSLIAVCLFVSNVFFWRQSGYFANVAEEKPMLHTWSLAVEEQYYLLFPLFLWICWRMGYGRLFLLLLVMTLASFLLCIYMAYSIQNANFFLLPGRAWELFAGSICAFVQYRKPVVGSHALSLAGLAMIIAAMLLLDKDTVFPSHFTLLPVVGTMLILQYASAGTITARVLSIRPLVGVGLISYSAYLWHQPIFAFARVRLLEEPSSITLLMLSILALVLAAFSWRFVEQPFRQRKPYKTISNRQMLLIFACGFTAVMSFGIIVNIKEGYENRFQETAFHTQKIGRPSDPSRDGCVYGGTRALEPHPHQPCLDKRSGQTVFLIGDSHADALARALRQKMAETELTLYEHIHTICLPFTFYKPKHGIGTRTCHQSNQEIYAYAKQYPADILVLAASWSVYLGDDPNGMLDQYEQAIKELLKDYKVVLVYPIPRADRDVPKYLLKHELYHKEKVETLSSDIAFFWDRHQTIVERFDSIVHPNLYRVKPHEVFCDKVKGICIHSEGEKVYYYDKGHLSYSGAQKIAPLIARQLKAM